MNKNKNYDLNFLITLYFINIVLYFITFSWMIILGKGECECGKNWKRSYIKYYIVVMFLIICVMTMLLLTNTLINNDDILTYVKYGMLMSEIIFVVMVFLYIRDLIRKGCNCQTTEQYPIYDNVDVSICIISVLVALIHMLL